MLARTAITSKIAHGQKNAAGRRHSQPLCLTNPLLPRLLHIYSIKSNGVVPKSANLRRCLRNERIDYLTPAGIVGPYIQIQKLPNALNRPNTLEYLASVLLPRHILNHCYIQGGWGSSRLSLRRQVIIAGSSKRIWNESHILFYKKSIGPKIQTKHDNLLPFQ